MGVNVFLSDRLKLFNAPEFVLNLSACASELYMACRLLSRKSSVGTIKNPDGTFCINDQEKANILNGYFGSVWVDDDGSNPVFPSRVPSDTFIDNFSITSISVLKRFPVLKIDLRQAKKLSLYFMLKKLASNMSSALASIFS